MRPIAEQHSKGLGAALATSLCVLVCGGDYTSNSDGINPHAGNASARNVIVHTIDPWSARSRNTRIDVDGERVRVAIERYKANKSLPPRGLATQQFVRSAPDGNK
jgi:hypothetical protein